jgi:long-chain acyl-CoA synthetase
MNTADYLLANGDDAALALFADQKRHTYASLRGACARLAGELRAAGVAPGEQVGILGNNSLFWVAAYLAAFKLGAVAVPFATTATPDEVSAMQQFAHCKVVCVERRALRRFGAVLNGATALIQDDVLESAGPVEWPPSDDVPAMLASDAALMFTSGTTARPRAVRVTHRNLQANTESIVEYLSLEGSDRIAVVLPFYYCYGASLLHTHLRAGGSLVFINSFVYPETVLDAMAANECTSFAGVPSTFQTLLRNSTFPRREWKRLRKIQQAGGKLPNVLIEELRAAVPDAQVFVMYGQTEATARLSYLPPAMLGSKLGSIGRGIPGVELRVIGEDGMDVKPGEIGEICAWGDNITPGYLDDPDATAARYANGGLRSGDLATVDDDGYIYIVDRKADFIKSYGYRVSSQQVEACALELPDVVAAAAIGEPDLVRGEAIKVFVTLRKDSGLSPEEIIAHCAQRLARHMIPSAVVVLERLPMNAHGKVVKSELRKLPGVELL